MSHVMNESFTGPDPVGGRARAAGNRTDDPFGDGRVTRRRRWITVGAGVVLLAVAVAAAIYLTRGKSEASEAAAHATHGAAPAGQTVNPVMLTADQARRIGVTYATAAITPMRREIRTVGQVTFDETRVRTISPKIEGWVEQLYVNYTGQPVAAGQPLLAIYSPMLVAAQEELLLAVRLTQDVGAGSAEARRSAEELLTSTRRRLAYWDIPAVDIAAIERSGQIRRAMTLRAPYGGYVLEKNVLAGQKIMMGDALYKVADLNTVWVEGDVFEQDLAAIRLGQSVTAEFESMPGRTRQGRITYIYPTINPETRTAKIRVALTNPRMELKPGMYATLRVDGRGATATALTVPRSAVLMTGQRNLVFVRRADGMLEPRDVTIGAANDERIVILRGLAAGDVVVSSATFLVDAESNLGSLLGGSGTMPGMDMSVPSSGAPSAGAPTPAAPVPAPDPHAGHQE